MALVAYDNSSDESEEETKVIKKQKTSVKISIPALKEFEDEEEEKTTVDKAKMKTGSSLFSLLPPPKNSTSERKPGFVPYVLSSKKEKSLSTSKQSAKASSDSKIAVNKVAVSEEQESDDETFNTQEKSFEEGSNVSSRNDFFWLDDLASESNSIEQKNSLKVPSENSHLFGSAFLASQSTSSFSTVNNCLEKSELNTSVQYQQLSENYEKTVDSESESCAQQYQSSSDQQLSETNSDSKESLLEDKEFLKLQGRRRECEGINFIDVKADDQLTDKNEWLMKSISQEQTYRPKRKHGMPTQQQKRKHQITYLAFQAKEREMDLKNQWSLNSRTRRETQAKYGF